MPLDPKVDELIMVAGTTGRLALRKRLFNRVIPLDVFREPNITDANLSHNDISEIPPQIATWCGLTALDVRQNSLRRLPEEIGELQALTSLNAGGNALQQLPWALGRCTALTDLVADFSGVECLPEEIRSRPAIDSLPYFGVMYSVVRGGVVCKLPGWQFNNLPSILLSLDHIQELNLVSNNLQQLPPDLTLLTALSKIQLSKNKFDEIPPPIYQLSHLAALDMADNSVSMLPAVPPNLVTLEEIHLQGNRLGTVPRSIGQLSSLKILDLSFNQIAVLPDEIGSCISLLELRIHSNNMRMLPPTMSCLRSLNELRVEANPLRMLHFRVGLLPLQKLTFDFATFESPPPEVMKKGVEWALNYLRRLCGSELRRVLILDECGLFSYPSEIMYIPTLTRLSLMQNKLVSVPPEIALLTSLTDMNFYGNAIRDFADCCAGLTRLQSVNLSENQLVELPFSLGAIKDLKKLVILPNPHLQCPPLHVVESGFEPTIRFLSNVFQYKSNQCLDIGDFGLHLIPTSLAAETSITSLRLNHSRFDDVRSLQFSCAPILKELRLSNCSLEFIPPIISQCTHLEELDVSWNRLAQIGNEIRFCKMLITLNISHNPVLYLPDGLYVLSHFTNLVIEGVLTLIRPPLQVARSGASAVRQFQRTLERGVVTGRIDLTGVGLTDFSCINSAWQSMKELLIDGNAVVVLPPELSLSSSLQLLSCASCNLSTFPMLLNLQNSLTSLDIRGNTFPALPIEISLLSSLKKLRAASVGLLSTPSWMATLSRLQELDISSNSLISPEAIDSITALVNLTKLNLENNGKLFFPEHFDRLRHLKSLHLRGNGLIKLPYALLKLNQLHDVDTAQMKDLILPPQELVTKDWAYLASFMSHIQKSAESLELNLSSLQLRSFPLFVCDLVYLRQLDLSGNEVTSIPEGISRLSCLSALNLSNCPITSISIELGSLDQLGTFRIDSQYIRESSARWGVADESMLLSVLRSLHFGRSQKQPSYDLSYCGLNDIPGHENCTHGFYRGWMEAISLTFSGNSISDLDQLQCMHSLLSLNLAKNKISRLPASFRVLSGLTALSLSGNFFTEMPLLLSSFDSLRTLDFSSNKLVGIPQYFKGFTSLVSLRISFNPISSLPYYFWSAPSLNRVETEGCSILSPPVPVITFGVRAVVNYLAKVEQAKISQILSLVDYNLVEMPLEPSKIPCLTHLDLSRNKLSVIPDGISLIRDLQTFVASHNCITSISDKISQLSCLKCLRLSHNIELACLPESLAFCTSLTEVSLAHCGFRSCPVEICGSGNIKSIDLMNCPLMWPKQDIISDPYKTADCLAQFARTVASKFISFEGQKDCTSMPVQVSCNAYLTDINVSNCSIKVIDGAILMGMSALTRLRLDRNLLSVLPDEMCELVSLKDLRISSNSLVDIPFTMTSLLELSIFDAASNCFEEIPLAVRYWPSIRAITVAGNSIFKVPLWISELTTLRTLNLSENQLKIVPSGIINLTNLRSLALCGNELSSPPICLVSSGDTLAIFRYLKIIHEANESLHLDKMNLTDVGDISIAPNFRNLHFVSCSMNPISELNDSVFQLLNLSHLNISNCHFIEIPSAMSLLTKLSHLDVSFNRLIAAGASLGQCFHLAHLDLSHNPSLNELEYALGRVSSLTTIHLVGCKVDFPPPEVTKRGTRFILRFLEAVRAAKEGSSLHLRGFFLESLHEKLKMTNCHLISFANNQLRLLSDHISSYVACTHLDISGNMLQKLPDSISSIKFLKILLADDNVLSALPSLLGQLVQLRVLSLGHNLLDASAFPDQLSSCSSLSRVIVDHNPLHFIPTCILNAPLKFLSLQSCELTAIPVDASSKLSNLTELLLSNNQLSSLPDLSGWNALQKLKLSHNCLLSIPNSIQFLTNLKELFLNGNVITDAPVELGSLSNLSYLHLGDSFAGEIPQEILRTGGVTSVLAYLSKLKEARSTKEFDLRHFNLRHVPLVVKSIIGLRKLNLDGNQISYLPLWLCEILSLTDISLQLCPISSLPVSLARLTNLINLRLPPGGILFPPPGTVAAGTQSILEYLGSILQNKDSGVCALKGMNLFEFPVELCRCEFITHLDLRNNHIEQIPPEIVMLTGLKVLQLEGCPIDSSWESVLCRGIEFLQKFCDRALVRQDLLGYVDLSETQITNIPSNIVEQCNLVSFVANSNPIRNISPSLQFVTSLTQLSLSHCELSELSEAFAGLNNIILLDLSFNQLKLLPDFVKSMTNLQNLNISCNPISGVDAIKYLTALVQLNIQDMHLADVPLVIAKLPLVESIFADWTLFPSLPDHHSDTLSSVLNFVKLLARSHASSNVWLQQQELITLPPCVLEWKSIVSINASFNKLKYVDDTIFELPFLQELNVSHNLISDIPHALHSATRLLKLDIRSNPITKLPVALGACVKPSFEICVDTDRLVTPSQKFIMRGLKQLLRLFSLMWNGYMTHQIEINELKLCSVPENIFDIGHLMHLSLCRNDIEVLPAGISCLIHLQRLDVSFNKLNSLCPELSLCISLVEIIVDGNPMLAHCPPKPLLTAGVSFVRQYLHVLLLASFNGYINLLSTPTPGIYLADTGLPLCHSLNLSNRPQSLMNSFIVGASHSQLQVLTSLCILNCGISEIPNFVSTLTGLKSINLGFNNKELGCNFDFSSCFLQLSRLFLHGCGFHALPAFVLSLSTLNDLILSDNPLYILPNGFFHFFPKLCSFSACTCGFVDIDPSIASLHSTLTTLDLSFNPLPSHNLAQIAVLSRLKSVSVYGCGLNILPPRWGSLKAIEYVGIEEHGIENVPPQVVRGGGKIIARYLRLIDAGPATVELDLSDMALDILPPIIHSMRNLQILKLNNNPFIRLPSWLGELNMLQSLHCNNLPLIRLPATIGALPNLSILDCSGCQQLKSPPPNIVSSGFAACINYMRRCYKAVETNQLDVAALGLSEFPFEAASSPWNLTSADAKCNLIQIITPDVQKMFNLRQLDLSDNSLRTLPWEIGYLSNLETLLLQKNPLQWLPFTVGASPCLHTLLFDSHQIMFPSRSVSMLGCQASIAFLQGFYCGWSCGRVDVSSSVIKLQCMPPELLLLMTSIDVRRFDNIMHKLLQERSSIIESQKKLAVSLANQDYLDVTSVLRTSGTPASGTNRSFETSRSPLPSPVHHIFELYRASEADYNLGHHDAVLQIGRIYLGHLGRRFFRLCANLMLGISTGQDNKPIPAFDRFVHKVMRPVTAELKQRYSYEAFMDRTSKHFIFDPSNNQLRPRPKSSPVKVDATSQRINHFESHLGTKYTTASNAQNVVASHHSTRTNALTHMPSKLLLEPFPSSPSRTRTQVSNIEPSHATSESSIVETPSMIIPDSRNDFDHTSIARSPPSTSLITSTNSVPSSLTTPASPALNKIQQNRSTTSKFSVPAPISITIGGEEFNESSPLHRALLKSASRVSCASEFDVLWITQDGAVLSACDDDHHVLQSVEPSADDLQALQFTEPIPDESLARDTEVLDTNECSIWQNALHSTQLWTELAAPMDWVRLNPSNVASNPFPIPSASCDEYLGFSSKSIPHKHLNTAITTRALGAPLTSMNFSNAGLMRIPTWIVSLSTLTALDVSNNHLGHFPLPVANLVHIVSLKADGCAIDELPDNEIWVASSLSTLSLNNNSLQGISSLLLKPSLVSLSVSKNNLRKLIMSHDSFCRLRALDLSDNPLVVFVVGSRSCPELQYLNLQRCHINVLSPSIARCGRLQVLLMSFSRVMSLPSNIGMLSIMTTLHLRQTRIHMLPPELACCAALRDLNVAENDMLEPPQCVIDSGVAVTMSYMCRIIEGRRLGTARLDSFNLGVVPLGSLSSFSLRCLELRRNGITVIPHAISLLTCLSELALSHNSIKSVPDELLYISTLNVLTLDHNEVAYLPFSLGNLRRLQVLDLSHNQLQQLPISLGDVRGLVTLAIDSNPLAYTLKLLAQQSPSAVLEFLRALHDGQSSGTLYLSGRGLFDVPRECGLIRNLRRIVMKDNQLNCLPIEVFKELSTVVSIDLSYNNFVDFPIGLSPLTQLEHLDMSHNPLKVVSVILCTLTRLHTLVFDSCPLQSFPWGDLKQLVLLETLAIETVDPTLSPEATVPSELLGSASSMYLSSLSQCRSNGVLDLAELGLAVLPPVVTSFAFLVCLNVNGNNLLCLPESVSKLTQLSELSCMDNRLRTIPSAIGACAVLSRINVACNRLVSLPAQLAMLRKLKVIYINDNPELMCPPPKVYLEGHAAILQFCERLLCAQLAGSRLDLSQMQLTQICIPVERCVVSASLTVLNLDENCFAEVPAYTSAYSSLSFVTPAQELSVRKNRLSVLPTFLNTLKSLQVLYVSHNFLEQVPVPVCMLPRLRCLDVSNNRIRFLPPQVSDSSSLTSLHLHANDLRQLPHSLASLASLRTLTVYGNPIAALPEALIMHAAKAGIAIHTSPPT